MSICFQYIYRGTNTSIGNRYFNGKPLDPRFRVFGYVRSRLRHTQIRRIDCFSFILGTVLLYTPNAKYVEGTGYIVRDILLFAIRPWAEEVQLLQSWSTAKAHPYLCVVFLSSRVRRSYIILARIAFVRIITTKHSVYLTVENDIIFDTNIASKTKF